MKKIATLILLFSFSFAYSQSLPIDFESSITTADFVDFDGGMAEVIPNPKSNGINTSATVAQIVREGGEIWAGSKVKLAANLDFSDLNTISMKIFSAAPTGTTVKFKLEGNGAVERDAQTTVTNEWETLTWDFTGVPSDFNEVVFMFDFGNVGDGSATSTFLFDDIEQFSTGVQIDWPVDFEGSIINYTTTDFGGNASSLVVDPTDANNMVIQAIKTDKAATWAGTTIGTPAGFKRAVPLTLSDSKMTVRVWSPTTNTPIRLKVEDSNDPTHTCETETNTTVAGQWEILEFDFANQAPGTELLSVGVTRGWRFNMASIFFNFGTEGTDAGEQTYYFDDVRFGDLSSSVDINDLEGLSVFPNPTNQEWTISIEKTEIQLIELFDLQGKLIHSQKVNSSVVKIDASRFSDGIYFSKIFTEKGMRSVRLVKK